jgi:hypothetical protein
MALVVGSEVVARYPDGVAAGCLALARPAGAPLLGVTLARDAEGEWVLEDGRLFPTCVTVDVRHSRPSAAHWVACGVDLREPTPVEHQEGASHLLGGAAR